MPSGLSAILAMLAALLCLAGPGAAGAAGPAAMGRAGGGATVVMYAGRALPIQVFPPDNPWNRDISALPAHPRSRAYIAAIGADRGLHPDFSAGWGRGEPYGLPYNVVRAGQKLVPLRVRYAAESDPGPYPVPPGALVEKGGDAHLLVLDYDRRMLYEFYGASRGPSGWRAGSAAVFDLLSNRLRPPYWTSADAAGLPVFPGLARHEELAVLGEIPHALRFTAMHTQRAFIPPATHFASASRERSLPPMGLRVRLRAGYDISGFPPQARTILACLKKYGMLLADNGGDWYLTGAPSAGWDDRDIESLKRVKGRDLEAVYTGEPLR